MLVSHMSSFRQQPSNARRIWIDQKEGNKELSALFLRSQKSNVFTSKNTSS